MIMGTCPVYVSDGATIYEGEGQFIITLLDLSQLAKTKTPEELVEWIRSNSQFCFQNQEAIYALGMWGGGYGWEEQFISDDMLRAIVKSPFSPDKAKRDASFILEYGWPMPQREPKKPRVPRKGWIYVIGGNGYCKIGQTNDLKARMKAFDTKLPFPVTLIHTIPTEDMGAAEKRLHTHFKDKRAGGEWFALDEQDLAWLKELESI